MQIFIQLQNQHGGWIPYSTSNHYQSAYKQSATASRNSGKRFRLIDDSGNILDIINP
jgi:hypothetical protein